MTRISVHEMWANVTGILTAKPAPSAMPTPVQRAAPMALNIKKRVQLVPIVPAKVGATVVRPGMNFATIKKLLEDYINKDTKILHIVSDTDSLNGDDNIDEEESEMTDGSGWSEELR